MTNYLHQKRITESRSSGFYIKNILPVTILFMLSGCGNSSTTAVKDLYIDDAMTMTTSQLLDNRRICEDVQWSNFEDRHKRTVVEYKCTFVNTADFLAKKRNSYLNSQNMILNERIKDIRDKIVADEDEIANLTNNGEKITEDKLKRYNIAPAETSDHLTRLSWAIDQLDKLKNNYSDDSYINFLLTHEFQSLLGLPYTSPEHAEMLEFFSDSMRSFKAQVGWMRRKTTAAEQENYKRQNVDRYLQGMRQYMDELNIYFNSKLESENKRIQELKAAHIARLAADKAMMLESIAEDIENLKKRIIYLNKSIASTEEELGNLKKKSDELYPKYENIIETFQWIVNKENQPTPAYGDLVAISSDQSKNKMIIKHQYPEEAFIAISKIDTDNYEEYVQRISVGNFLNFIYN
ncbi:hypothetical protein [Shewanella algae]|uniref:hypothetical protein n=1 Tax=Shewanella algae TaxID=38313 RepID=UPI0031F4A8D1